MIVRPIAWTDPCAAGRLFKDAPYTQFLHSAGTTGPHHNRWSLLVFDPVDRLENSTNWPDVERRINAMGKKAPAALPFQGGAVGIFGYDSGFALENTQTRHRATLCSGMNIGFYDRAVLFDHRDKATIIIAPDTDTARDIETRLRDQTPPVEYAPGPAYSWQQGVDDATMAARVQAIIDAIYAGDIFQANIALSFKAPRPRNADPFADYIRLMQANPAAYGGYAHFGEWQMASCSPEQFLSLDGRAIKTRPIKGTAPRGHSPEDDAELAATLSASAKDRAENTMIVDLMRNDLSRVCDDDSVAVPVLCALETQPSVHHLVSTVTGRLRPGITPLQALMACFPGGSITGAPKIRAMQLIDAQEDETRGSYCGSWGYISRCGRMDTNILIRTVLYERDIITLKAGAGIVAQSDARREVDEMRAKAARILATLGNAP